MKLISPSNTDQETIQTISIRNKTNKQNPGKNTE